MKNITITLDDDNYRKARVAAAHRDTSVSALVKKFLRSLAAEAPAPGDLKRSRKFYSTDFGKNIPVSPREKPFPATPCMNANDFR
ncbi:MAG: DUF6364 family protein [Verrucomicrobiota bacterium]